MALKFNTPEEYRQWLQQINGVKEKKPVNTVDQRDKAELMAFIQNFPHLVGYQTNSVPYSVWVGEWFRYDIRVLLAICAEGYATMENGKVYPK